MSSSIAKLSIVIACRNRDDNLKLLFESLLSQTLDPSLYELIIVNYGGDHSTETLLKNYNFRCNVNYLYVEEYGVFNESRSKNIGIRSAVNDWVISINADIYLPPDTLERVIDEIKVSGKSFIYQVTRYDCPEGFDFIDFSKTKEFSALACGDFQGAHREIWDELFAYDEHMTGWGWMDNDLVLKAVKKGYIQKWVNNAKIYHQYHPENAERKSHLNIMFTQSREKLNAQDRNWGMYPKKEKTLFCSDNFVKNRNKAFIENYDYVCEGSVLEGEAKNPKTEILFYSAIKIKNPFMAALCQKVFYTDTIYRSRKMRVRTAMFCNDVQFGFKYYLNDLNLYRQCKVEGLITECVDTAASTISGFILLFYVPYYLLSKICLLRKTKKRQKMIQESVEKCRIIMESMK